MSMQERKSQRLRNIIVVAIANLLVCSLSAQSGIVPAKPVLSPEEETLRKLIAIATNPNDNGLQLVDTFSRHSKYLITNSSSLAFPNAIGTAILSRQTRYDGNMARVVYTWTSRLKEIQQHDTVAMYTSLGRLQEIIARTIPNVKDSFYNAPTYSQAVELTWSWKPAAGIELRLRALTGQRYNLPNQITLELSAHKTLKQDKKRILDSLFHHYDTLINGATSRNELVAYSVTLYNSMEQEGLSQDEAIKKFKPVFKKVADKDIAAAFEIMLQVDSRISAAFRSELSADQALTIRKLAQGVVDDFNAKYYGAKPQSQTKTNTQTRIVKAAVEPYNAYYTNAEKPDANSKYVYIYSKDTLGNYKVKTAWITPNRGKGTLWSLNSGPVETVNSSYFEKDGQKWVAVHIGHCVGCGGSGVEVTRTPYTYYREEKGIYNKYTYSGSGVNVTSKTCSMCYGAGYSITRIQ